MASKTAVLTAIGAALGAALIASPACAQVLSIGDDGAVTTYAGPAVFTSDGVTAIAAPEPAPLYRAPTEEVLRLIQESSVRHAVPAARVTCCRLRMI